MKSMRGKKENNSELDRKIGKEDPHRSTFQG
jgi:hypothetical protein